MSGGLERSQHRSALTDGSRDLGLRERGARTCPTQRGEQPRAPRSQPAERVRGEVGSKGLLRWRLLPHAVAAMLTEQSKREGEPVAQRGERALAPGIAIRFPRAAAMKFALYLL